MGSGCWVSFSLWSCTGWSEYLQASEALPASAGSSGGRKDQPCVTLTALYLGSDQEEGV